jgi:DNA-binding beta-propeller fold protein YncE
MSFKVGSRVQVTGLVAAAALLHNGKPGTVCSAVEQSAGRVYIVKLDEGRFLKIKPMNLAQIPLSGAEGRKLNCRLDVRDETLHFTARPLLLLAFQSRQKHLQAIWRPSQQAFWGQPATPLQATVAHIHYSTYSSGSCLTSVQRRNLLARCRHSMTLAVKLVCFQGECAIRLPLKHASSILSRRHELQISRLGAVSGFAVRPKFRTIGSRWNSKNNFEGFNLPRCVAFDGEGNLVVSDGLNHCIEVFRWGDGAHLRTIGCKGTGAGQFNHPWGVAFDDVGHIIVSEYEGHRVQVLRYSDGAHVCTFGGSGSDNGQFKYPSGIAIDGEGNVAVFDDGNGRVQVHRLCDGTHLRTIGSRGSNNGQFGGGRGVAFDHENNLVVADRANHRVQVLRYSDGAHLRNIGGPGTDVAFNSPSGVAFDAAGHIVVVERDNHCVQVLRYSDGAHVRTIGGKGSGKRMTWDEEQERFNEPSGGIAIDRDGCIVLADTQNNRVQVFK